MLSGLSRNSRGSRLFSEMSHSLTFPDFIQSISIHLQLDMPSKLYYTSPAPINSDRDTIIFIHAATFSSTMWVDQIDYLKVVFPSTNLLLIDCNGHGKTTEGRKHFALYDQGADIVELMVRTPYVFANN